MSARATEFFRWQALFLIAATIVKVFKRLATGSRVPHPEFHDPWSAVAGGVVCLSEGLAQAVGSAAQSKEK